MTGMRWVITPLGMLSDSLKRELGVHRHDGHKLERAVDRAIEDLKTYMTKHNRADDFTALVMDGADLKLIRVQKQQ